jgi:ubiquinone/menaquinone biosynthesis C-methylase UbiE
MEEQQQITKREPREWDAQAYAKGNRTQQQAALHFLSELNIDFMNKKVLDIGCGTGNITEKIAKIAQKAHGIDASKNMIEYAQTTYGHNQNLSFEQCFAEDFATQKKFDTAVTLFCLHWIENKKAVIKKTNLALEINGNFFGTHQSTSDPEPLHLTVLKEMIPGLSTMLSFLQSMNWIQATEYHIISDEEFQQLLSQNGFEIVSYEQKSFDITISKQEIEDGIRPVLMSRPFMKIMPESIQEWFFNYYINKNLEKLTQKEDGNYLIPAAMWGTKVFHARKVKDI